MLVTTFGGASKETLVVATDYNYSLPLTTPSKSLPHQNNIHNYFDIDEPCNGPWANSIYKDPGKIHRFFLQNLDSMANDQDKMDILTLWAARNNILHDRTIESDAIVPTCINKNQPDLLRKRQVLTK